MKNSSFFHKKELIETVGLENIDREVLRPFKKLRKFLLDEYMPNTRPGDISSQNNPMFVIFVTLEIASSSLPNGKEFYQQCLKFHTSTNMTGQQRNIPN